MRIVSGILAEEDGTVTSPPDPTDPDPDIDPDDGGDGDFKFDTGLRRLHVSATLADPQDGTTADAKFTTIQAALNAAQAGDVITVANGTYREILSRSNLAGTVQNPIWLVAENRGQATISDTISSIDNGTAVWTLDSDGVYTTPRNVRPYVGSHGADFLMGYLSEADLRATTITAPSAIAGGANVTVNKPSYGFAWDSGSNTLFVRLRGNADPNGQSIKFTNTFARNQVNLTNVDNFILDGFVIIGAGNTQAVNCSSTCDRVTIRNCVFRHVRHAIGAASNMIIENNNYEYVGFDKWCKEIIPANTRTKHPPFVILKGYFTAARVSAAGTAVGGGQGNALLEGSLEFATSTKTNVLVERNVIGPCFDGSRIGEFNNSILRENVFKYCLDDGLQNESAFGNAASGNIIHDNRFLNCFHAFSHQENTINGEAHVFRNLSIWNDPDIAVVPNYDIKMISTPQNADIFYYHNTWVLDFGQSFGGSLSVWTDFGGATANRILRFFNNIVIIPRDLSDGGGPNPPSIQRNAVVGPSAGSSAFLTAGGGRFAGTTAASMQLNADFSLKANSPAVGLGQPLPAGFPDSRQGANANKDAGAFPLGEIPGPNWPRPSTFNFVTTLPARWTSPGA